MSVHLKKNTLQQWQKRSQLQSQLFPALVIKMKCLILGSVTVLSTSTWACRRKMKWFCRWWDPNVDRALFCFFFWFVAIFPTCFRVFIQNASNHRWGGFRTLGDVKRPNPICTVNKALGVTSDVKLQWKFFFYCLHLSNKLFKNYKRAFFYFNSHFICTL